MPRGVSEIKLKRTDTTLDLSQRQRELRKKRRKEKERRQEMADIFMGRKKAVSSVDLVIYVAHITWVAWCCLFLPRPGCSFLSPGWLSG